jgi:TolB-like protein/DNA-binding winged helix-turn-helix (wHTH) protein/Tfp pilus assembly protein PilF
MRHIENICASRSKSLQLKGLAEDTTKAFDAKGPQSYTPPAIAPMEKCDSSARIIRFGAYELDLRAGKLTKRGHRIRLQEQPFQILTMLLDRRGELVTREELRKRIWRDDTFVDFDHSLNAAVMRLRDALSDSSDNPRFIETVPKRGYRFVASIEEVASSQATEIEKTPVTSAPVSEAPLQTAVHSSASANKPAPVPSARRASFRQAALYTAVTLTTAALIFLLIERQHDKVNASHSLEPQIKSVVVLPLENLSGEKDQEYFADGMTDDLIANLAKIRALRVISRSTAMAYKGTHKALPQIAVELNVDAVVEGTVLRAGNRVRITAELVQVATDRPVWAETYEGHIGDILGLQNQVSSAIADEIRIKLTPEEKERFAKSPAVSPDVYESYLKGRYYWNKRSKDNLSKAISYFEYATRKDPNYALAFAGLADCYGIIGASIFGRLASEEASPKAKAAALRALQLDPSLAEAETSLATSKLNYDWDWTGAEDGFKRAINLNPSYATGYQRYSLYLTAMGRHQASLEQIERARELDPLSISINFSMGWRIYLARQYDRAIQQLQATLEMDPTYDVPYLILGQAYEQKGDYVRAIAAYRKGAEMSSYAPPMSAALARAYALAGNQVAAEKLLDQILAISRKHYVSPYYPALVYAGLGQNGEALDYLEKGFEDHSNGMIFLRVEPQLDSLRSSPRFIRLLQRMAFPD